MDVLSQKTIETTDYTCRYNSDAYYFNKTDKKYIYGFNKNLKTTTAWVMHKVKQGDTLESLSLNYYNNPSFWWLIADFNRIRDAFIDNLIDKYTTLKIPSISSIEFSTDR